MTIALTVIAISVLAWIAIMIAFSLTARKPENLGLKDGRLRPCPGTPNCVCTFDEGTAAIDPLTFSDSADTAWERLKKIVREHPRTVIVTDEGDYLHAECTSLIFRFVDDLEFALDREHRRIHVRSASRAGRSDFGVNRARVEAIREAFGS
jgi:uncharacterized protein (DUF1499 family)